MKTDIAAVIGAIQKHLPGKHNQQMHAGDLRRSVRRLNDAPATRVAPVRFETVSKKLKEMSLVENMPREMKMAVKEVTEQWDAALDVMRSKAYVNLSDQEYEQLDSVKGAAEQLADDFAEWSKTGVVPEMLQIRYKPRKTSGKNDKFDVVGHVVNAFDLEGRGARYGAGKLLSKAQTIGDVFIKHLAGKHDQQSHANKGTGGVSIDKFKTEGAKDIVRRAQAVLIRTTDTPALEGNPESYAHFNAALAAAGYLDKDDVAGLVSVLGKVDYPTWEDLGTLRTIPAKFRNEARKFKYESPDLGRIDIHPRLEGGSFGSWPTYRSQTIGNVIKHLAGKHDQQTHAGALRSLLESIAQDNAVTLEVGQWGSAKDYKAVTRTDLKDAAVNLFPDARAELVRDAIDNSSAVKWNNQAHVTTGERNSKQHGGGYWEETVAIDTPESWVSPDGINVEQLITDISNYVEE